MSRALGVFPLVCIVLMPVDALAQTIREQRLNITAATTPALLENRIAGETILDYIVTGERSQMLSVDLMTSNASA